MEAFALGSEDAQELDACMFMLHKTFGAVAGDLGALRGLTCATQELRRYEPAGDEGAWAAERRVHGS